MQIINRKKTEEFNLENTKAEIDRLLKVYRMKKDDLEWADDDWEVGEIQEELDGYAQKIKVLKAKVREYEKSVKV
jgi:flagellar biosynthesis chaperone FliJ